MKGRQRSCIPCGVCAPKRAHSAFMLLCPVGLHPPRPRGPPQDEHALICGDPRRCLGACVAFAAAALAIMLGASAAARARRRRLMLLAAAELLLAATLMLQPGRYTPVHRVGGFDEDAFWAAEQRHGTFRQTYRLSPSLFREVHDRIRLRLATDDVAQAERGCGHAVSSTQRFVVALRFLAGGSVHDIRRACGKCV